ncbi:MAG: T9SS type A sorting domain-containing protein [Bacteroidales bacterium]|nr:T9SS type A sorting domain-containing protein [Bacteroidales bacterium]
MNTKRINILLVLAMLCAAVSLKAQNATVHFNYDANGNRTMRYLTFQKVEENGKSTDADNEALPSAIDFIASSQVSLYPNPTYGKFTVALTEMGEMNILATLSTTTGAVIQQCKLTDLQSTFDLSGQPAGVYLLRLSTDEETQVWKIVKQ